MRMRPAGCSAWKNRMGVRNERRASVFLTGALFCLLGFLIVWVRLIRTLSSTARLRLYMTG